MDRVPEPGRPLDLAVRFAWNYFRNNRYPQLTLVDWRVANS
jgi:single-stranded-DNA-specific exonuclease